MTSPLCSLSPRQRLDGVSPSSFPDERMSPGVDDETPSSRWLGLTSILYEQRWSAALCFVLFTGLGVLLWKYNSKAIQDIILWLAFVWAVVKSRRRASVWRNSVGVAFVCVLLYLIIGLPLSLSPRDSWRDFARIADVMAAAYAIPIIFNSRRKVAAALLYTATSLTLILGCDLVRLIVRVEEDLLSKAHEYEPFVLGHSPNIGALASAVAFVILFCLALRQWRRRGILAACVAGMAVNLAYLVVIASRGAQAAFAVTVVIGGVLLIRGGARWAAWIVVLAVVAAVGVLWFNPRLRDEVSMRGFSDRDKVWKHTWTVAQQCPVLGHGYGHRVFKSVYHETNPPWSPFHFNHPHQYWLGVLFGQGWLGVGFHAVAWVLLLRRLLRHIYREVEDPSERYVPLTVLLVIVLIHLFGMGDFPGSIARMMLIWLIPMTLVLTCGYSGGVSEAGLTGGASGVLKQGEREVEAERPALGTA